MMNYPQIDPIAFSLGPLNVHWYGLMYLIGFALAYLLGCYRAKQPNSGWTNEQVGDVIFYTALGGIVGGRLGYMLFYGYHHWMQDPLVILRVWEGGMSFHGGIIGLLIGVWLFSRRHYRPFWQITDFLAPLVPLGIAAGRIGNFINGELWGRVTDVAWAMRFPHSDGAPRHPSQLYEAALEGVVLFAILWWFSSKQRPEGAVSAVFFLGYGILRFIAEFFREPDLHIGFIAIGLTMGQVLCIPLIGFGAYLFWKAYKSR